jgi:hypothetical protein
LTAPDYPLVPVIIYFLAIASAILGTLELSRNEWFVRTVITLVLGGVLALAGQYTLQRLTEEKQSPPTIYTKVAPPDITSTGGFVGGRTNFGRCYRDFSYADPDRRDAHQCIQSRGVSTRASVQGGNRLDPCFPIPRYPDPVVGTRTFVCLRSPWDTVNDGRESVYLADGVLSTGWLPDRKVSPGPDRPWAMQLANGARCLQPKRRLAEPAGATYMCHGSGGELVGWIREYPNEKGVHAVTWTADFLEDGESTEGYNPVEVRRAWR